MARRHRNWYFQHFNQLLLWIKIYYIALCLLCKVYFSAQPNKLRHILKVRVRWFQLFVVDSFGQLSKSTGYRDKHLDLNGYGVGGLLYPPRTLPMWQNSFQVCKNSFLVSHCLNLIRSFLYSTKPPQLLRETLWIGWIRLWGWSTPPTSAHIVTEIILTGRKAHFGS